MTAGLLALASLNRLLISCSLSPSHLPTRSDDETEKNVECASVATALARYDLPQPIGYNIIVYVYVWRE